MEKITTEQIDAFLAGKNPIERVINIECAYADDKVKITARSENGRKYYKHVSFYPFLWAKYSACDAMCGGNRNAVKALLNKYDIKVEKLITNFDGGQEEDRIKNGYRFIFRAKSPMSYSKFLKFFKDAGVPVYSDRDDNDIPESKDESRKYLTLTPVEQYMISSGTRLFKGYDTYDDVYRMEWDLETEGLVAKRHRINQIGVRTNKGFEKIIPVTGNTVEELDLNELSAIKEFLQLIHDLDPDVIVGYNTENFDWPFIIERCQVLGVDFFELSKSILGHGIYKNQKPTTLKLGGEVETFYQTVVPGYIILDGLHAARRAQAGDSNMLKADLKYVTKYLSLNKPNRVYVPGDKINKTWLIETPDYGFNNDNGDWYRITEDVGLKEGYVPTTGKYIVERYLLDDLWETDKVELQLNQANFLINKIVPTGFARACTMGTAGIWKLIALAWSYEQGIVVPAFGPGGRFTGGLSRLCRTGYVKKVIKLDYNSLYPSIMLTWFIDPTVDIQAVLPAMLNYVLTQREKYKKLKKEGAKNAEKLREEYKQTGDEKLLPQIQHWENVEMLNDRLQNPLKILGNSAFGSFGAENLFPLGDKECAERITCTGRQSLRLMISWFMKLGYAPIVGDSFTEDTPVFIKYNESGLIDIKPICELIDENEIKIDELGREYDYSKKGYKVLCRSGWLEPSYIYRHKTDKDIYEVTDGDMKIEVTEDHSLFNDKQEKIKPSEINEETELEYYNGKIGSIDSAGKQFGTELFHKMITEEDPNHYYNLGKHLAENEKYENYPTDRVPVDVLNSCHEARKDFYRGFMENYRDDMLYSKTCLAGLQFLKKTVK